MSGDMCEDLCVLGLVEYQRCLYYENGKKVIEARWRGSPVILKSKLENFSSYEPLGILDYQVGLPAPAKARFCSSRRSSNCVSPSRRTPPRSSRRWRWCSTPPWR